MAEHLRHPAGILARRQCMSREGVAGVVEVTALQARVHERWHPHTPPEVAEVHVPAKAVGEDERIPAGDHPLRFKGFAHRGQEIDVSLRGGSLEACRLSFPPALPYFDQIPLPMDPLPGERNLLG